MMKVTYLFLKNTPSEMKSRKNNLKEDQWKEFKQVV